MCTWLSSRNLGHGVVAVDVEHHLPGADALGVDELTGPADARRHGALDDQHAVGVEVAGRVLEAATWASWVSRFPIVL
jgi:hypothetical protein